MTLSERMKQKSQRKLLLFRAPKPPPADLGESNPCVRFLLGSNDVSHDFAGAMPRNRVFFVTRAGKKGVWLLQGGECVYKQDA